MSKMTRSKAQLTSKLSKSKSQLYSSFIDLKTKEEEDNEQFFEKQPNQPTRDGIIYLFIYLLFKRNLYSFDLKSKLNNSNLIAIDKSKLYGTSLGIFGSQNKFRIALFHYYRSPYAFI